MDINFSVKDKQVKDFTDKAKIKVGTEAEKYAKNLITEAKGCERTQRGQGAKCEVTDSHVSLAKQKLTFKKKRPWWWYLITIATQILTLFLGIFFDYDRIVSGEQDNFIYVILMIVILILCIAGLFASILFGGE